MLLAAPVGLVIGLVLGALGGGGSVLTVPALVYLLGQDPHAATTGSLLVVGVSAVAGVAAHARAGGVRFGQGLVFGVIGAAGAYLGSTMSLRLDPALLLTLFAALLLVVASAMLVGQRRSQRSRPTAPDPAGPTVRWGPGRLLRVVVAASVVGLLTGIFGVGGGFVVVPALVLALDFPMRLAVGTSLLVIAVNSATALTTRLAQPIGLDWGLLAVFTSVAVVGTVVGSRLGNRIRPERLTTAFSVLLVAVAVYTALRSVPQLG